MEASSQMTLRRLAFSLFVLLISAPVARPGHAQTVDPDIEAAAIAPFEALELSARLARLGQARSDPWLLATAARIRASSPTRIREDGASNDEMKQDAAHGGDGVSSTIDTWNGAVGHWLDEAERLAEGDATALAYIASVRSLEFKGRTGGPLVSLSRLGGGQSQSFSERFTPGRPAVVYVEGDGDAPLSVGVSAGGVSVCQSNGPGDVKLCTWTSRSPGDYRVEVRNLGTAANRYAYGTN